MLALILIFLFSAFRFDVGWDYPAYYNTIKYGINTNIMNNNEYATILLIKFANIVEITNIYFFINTMICLIPISLTIKKYSKDHWLSIIFFVCFPLFYLNSLSVIRLFTALGLTFYGFRFIYEQKFYKYFFFVFLASMFHMSSIIALLFYFVRNIKLETKKIVIIMLLMPFFSNVINYVVFNYFPSYAVYTKITTVQQGTKSILVFIIIGLASLLLRKKVIDGDKIAELYLNIYLIGLSIYIMFLDQGTMGHRLSLYGTIYSLLLIPKLVSVINLKFKIYIKFIIYIVFFIMFLLSVKVGEATYIPYKTIFNMF